jgi:hypothetical protein
MGGKKLLFFTVSIIFFIPQMSYSESSGWVDVLRVTKQQHTLKIKISEAVGVDIGCENTILTFPPNAFQDENNEKQFYVALMSALLAKRKMTFWVTECTNAGQPYFTDTAGLWNIQ